MTVLTGGPCSGKTTFLNYLEEKLDDKGYSAVIVPETATELFKLGIRPGSPGISRHEFQKRCFLKQIEKEEKFLKKLRNLKNPRRVMVCDRGVMDAKAYMDPGEFELLIEELGYNVIELRDNRYDAVIHLVTAAIGAESFYTFDNNEARSETPAEARILDPKIMSSWIGHPHLRVIDNSTDFETKVKRAFSAICRVIGIPIPLEIERKYLIGKMDIGLLQSRYGLTAVAAPIIQSYLRSPVGITRRIRKRGKDGNFIYYYTEKTKISGGVRAESEKKISKSEYINLLNYEADDGFNEIIKKRYCFVWENQYFELDVFSGPERLAGLHLLEVELTEENDKVSMPPFIEVIRDVTEENEFTNYALARKNGQKTSDIYGKYIK